MAEISNWWNILAQYEHHQELLREAEKDRLARRALAGRGRSDRFYCKALGWLGRRLVAWGSDLQEHYGAVVTSRTLRPANGRR
jgi:hypothetical protein